MLNSRKKIIIISIIVVCVIILGVVAGIVINKISIKKEEERQKLALEKANAVLSAYSLSMSDRDELFDENDLFGYTFIVDMGDKYSDYVFMYEKTGMLELKDKVNFDHASKTVLTKDKKEYKLLTPMGERDSLEKYSEVPVEDYSETTETDVFIYYGDSEMGFIDRSEFILDD